MKHKRILWAVLTIAFLLFVWLSPLIPGFSNSIYEITMRIALKNFPTILIVFMLVHGTFAPTYRREGTLGIRQAEEIRKLKIRLLLWSSTAILATLLLGYLAVQAKMFACSLWALILIQFLIYEPLLNAKNPERKSPWKLPERIRTANLKPRAVENFVPAWCWGILWGFWGLVAVAALYDLQQKLRWNPFRWSRIEDAFAFLSISGIALILGPVFIRWWIGRPEPMLEKNREELELAYRNLRRFRPKFQLEIPDL